MGPTVGNVAPQDTRSLALNNSERLRHVEQGKGQFRDDIHR